MCQVNHLTLDISKTEEMIVDFRRQREAGHKSIPFGDAVVERVSIFKFLGVHITEDLTRTLQADTRVKKA